MNPTVDVALLILRVVAGLTVASHGAQKLLGWFGGPGMDTWEQGLRKQGFKPARIWAYLTVLGELGGGLSLAFGFLTPLGAAGIFGAMFMAILTVHWKNGFFNGKRGIEFPLALLAIATAIGVAGPGAISLDTLFGIQLPYPWLFVILAIIAVLVDLAGLAVKRANAASAAAATHAPA